MWSNPFSSFGWPNEIPSVGLSHSERLVVAKGNFNMLAHIIKKYPYRAISKATNAFYKFALMLFFLYSLFYIFIKNKKGVLKFLGLVSVSYLLARTTFFSLNGYFETRYISNVIPFMELLVALFFYEILYEKFKKSRYSKGLPDN